MKIMKKCPPGVVCIENMTLAFVVLCLLLLLYFIYHLVKMQTSTSTSTSTSTTNEKIIIQEPQRKTVHWLPSFPYNNLNGAPGDVLLDPYAPPLSDDRYFVPTRPFIPINVSTNVGAVDTNYRQVGILTSLNSKGKILALMGRPLFVNRDKWQYYTISDQHNNVKLPVSRAGRSCTNEYGCDRLYNGDTIFVEGYNEAFKVTIYDNDVIKYLPSF